MTCCRCNKKGICGNCSCVRDGKTCTSCIPKQLGRCRNVQSDCSLENQDNGKDVNLHPTSREKLASETASTDEDEIADVTQDNIEDVLPPFPHANLPDFKWGNIDGKKVTEDIDKIYSEIVHWRHNLFKVPSGKQGKAFIHEMARLFSGYAEATSMEGVAIKAAMVFPALVL